MVGATVRVYNGDKIIGTATVGKNGKYSVKIPSQKLYTKISVRISKKDIHKIKNNNSFKCFL